MRCQGLVQTLGGVLPMLAACASPSQGSGAHPRDTDSQPVAAPSVDAPRSGEPGAALLAVEPGQGFVGLRATADGWSALWQDTRAAGSPRLVERTISSAGQGQPRPVAPLGGPCEHGVPAGGAAGKKAPSVACVHGDQVREYGDSGTPSPRTWTVPEHHASAVATRLAYRPTSSPVGVVAWTAVAQEQAEHVCFAEGEEEVCAWETKGGRTRLLATVLSPEGTATATHPLTTWQPKGRLDALDIAVAESGPASVLWLESGAGVPAVLHAAGVGPKGLEARVQQVVPAPFVSSLGVVRSASGAVWMAMLAPAAEGRPGRVGVIGFEHDGRVAEPRMLRATVVWPYSAKVLECAGELWLVYVGFSQTRHLELRAAALTPTGADLLPPLWTGETPVPEGAAGLNTDLEFSAACSGDRAAVAGELYSAQGKQLLFADWVAERPSP